MSDTAQPTTLDNRDIIEMLGLSGLSEEQKQLIITKISRESIIRVIKDYLNTEATSEVKQQLDLLLSDGKNPLDVQNELINIIPDLTERVYEQAQILKMEMCLRQMKDLIPKLNNPELQELLIEAESAFKEKDKVKFVEIWDRFAYLKNNV